MSEKTLYNIIFLKVLIKGAITVYDLVQFVRSVVGQDEVTDEELYRVIDLVTEDPNVSVYEYGSTKILGYKSALSESDAFQDTYSMIVEDIVKAAKSCKFKFKKPVKTTLPKDDKSSNHRNIIVDGQNIDCVKLDNGGYILRGPGIDIEISGNK